MKRRENNDSNGILPRVRRYPVLMTTDKALVALMSVELMLNAANVNFITFAAYHVGADATIGNIFVLMSIAIAAAEVAVGIALILNAYKIRGSSSTDDLTTMRW